jgi:hypothetical protein
MVGASAPRNSNSFLMQHFLIALLLFAAFSMWLHSTLGGADSLHKIHAAFQAQHFSVASMTQDKRQAVEQMRIAVREEKKRNKAVTNEADVKHHDDAQVTIQLNHTQPNRAQKVEKPNDHVLQVHESNKQQLDKQQGHTLAGLDCTAHGGPSNEKAKEMVYWSDISSDNAHVSPFYDSNKYMTFEPDPGGWNNIRMSMESVLAMAVAMGRTLVLPPKQGMYLLDKDEHQKDNQFSFNDFYHLESIANEHGGLNVITMEQFLQEQAMTGKLKDSAAGKVLLPPGNKTDWDTTDNRRNGLMTEYQHGALTNYLRKVSLWPQSWNPDKCLAAFPASKHPQDLQKLVDLKTKIESTEWDKTYKRWNSFQQYLGKPTAVNATTEERAQEMLALRQTLCIYDAEMQEAPLIHFGVEYGGRGQALKGARLLIHFYAFLFFQDWRQDLWMKRFVRDHVRYVDEIQCAAARIVQAVRERAKTKSPASNGEYDAFHIRRGDFQYHETRVEADKIYQISKDELTPNTTVYVGTDERNRTFFKPLADNYDIVFLDDFKHLVKDVNSNYMGMLDQLVTSRARIFFGCFFSSFTGHITRLRGYHSVHEQLPGYKNGALPSTYYYAEPQHKFEMRDFVPVRQPFWSREFPAAWRGIDESIGKMKTVS